MCEAESEGWSSESSSEKPTTTNEEPVPLAEVRVLVCDGGYLAVSTITLRSLVPLGIVDVVSKHIVNVVDDRQKDESIGCAGTQPG